ncbi:Rieske 2Fe-2S domain-containing protein [Halorubrum lacusprofundi]|jgi:Rieske Fe-S protein|uniref:Menaquinol--cytochrome-c reductase n=1 Tax=Halorubrum lacusprofundi (strain ATCC 49239 / DSM 5036 / JCM 8891 / ACAM 34) TaxID=416348 RepID=B9LS12_HALLT|nr:Rieske 2Fe-2S domain-containing protein [Halorubrum lacusprofundi]ACM57886.1 menaquinol--cytochrome-c reductase [Halorubrum lacusprofundi ATCC 49239]MCG1006961.1 Rieske 2Fe-2S domain-containing protein [Halorubrum lacusprofundi]
MSQSDKYPAESGRRRFVKGVVGGAALSGVGAMGSATVNTLTTSGGVGGGSTIAMTIEKTGGPAPRGLPQVPVEVTDDGYIRGIWPETQTITQEGQEIQVAQEQLGGKTYTGAWYQYCGVESQENIEPDYEAEDNLFRAAPGKYDWMDEVYDEGERIHIDDFDDYDEWGNGIGDDGVGKPASVTWRSQNAETALNVNVIRSSRIEEAVENSGDEWLEASTDQGFVAYLNVCTHFCCIPDYKVLEESARYDAANGVYCVCHQSVYNPFTLEEALFIARPRPDE